MKIYLMTNPNKIGIPANNNKMKPIASGPPAISWYAAIGPIKPAEPKPAELAVPLILKIAPTNPAIPADAITGKIILDSSTY